jgi:hypothetical protein
VRSSILACTSAVSADTLALRDFLFHRSLPVGRLSRPGHVFGGQIGRLNSTSSRLSITAITSPARILIAEIFVHLLDKPEMRGTMWRGGRR